MIFLGKNGGLIRANVLQGVYKNYSQGVLVWKIDR